MNKLDHFVCIYEDGDEFELSKSEMLDHIRSIALEGLLGSSDKSIQQLMLDHFGGEDEHA